MAKMQKSEAIIFVAEASFLLLACFMVAGLIGYLIGFTATLNSVATDVSLRMCTVEFSGNIDINMLVIGESTAMMLPHPKITNVKLNLPCNSQIFTALGVR